MDRIDVAKRVGSFNCGHAYVQYSSTHSTVGSAVLSAGRFLLQVLPCMIIGLELPTIRVGYAVL